MCSNNLVPKSWKSPEWQFLYLKINICPFFSFLFNHKNMSLPFHYWSIHSWPKAEEEKDEIPEFPVYINLSTWPTRKRNAGHIHREYGLVRGYIRCPQVTFYSRTTFYFKLDTQRQQVRQTRQQDNSCHKHVPTASH